MMKKPAFKPIAVLQGVAIVGSLSLLLLVGQISWTPAAEQITPATLASQLETPAAPLVLDVRSAAEYAEGHIPGALNIPYQEIPARLAELTAWQDDAIVVYCEVGVRAGIAELTLKQAGFEKILQLEGDIQAWRQAGLPLVTPTREAQR